MRQLSRRAATLRQSTLLSAIATLLLLSIGHAVQAAPSELQIISQPLTGGASGNSTSSNPDVDDSGDVIVFNSMANDLVRNDSGPLHDVFVYTRETNGLSSITAGGNDHSGLPAISPEGRYVAFISNATNLGGPDTNGTSPNVFLFDRQTERFTIGPPMQGEPYDSFDLSGDFGPIDIDVSADGELVALLSSARALLPEGRTLSRRLYLWNPATGEVKAVRPEVDMEVNDFDLSDDGRFVVFDSWSPDILDEPLDTHAPRLYLYNILDDTIELLLDNERPTRPVISADGRHVAYLSTVQNRGQFGAPHVGANLFTLDTQTNEVQLVDKDFAGANPVISPNQKVGTIRSAISSDGNRIAFLSRQRHLVPNDNNGAHDIFLWDRTTGQTSRLTPGANRGSLTPALDGTGSTVVFASAATNLLQAEDNNGAYDVFAWREDIVEGPDCEPTESGVLTSSSGARVTLQGTTACFGYGLYSYGTPDNAGMVIPAERGRPELRLFPVNDSDLPAHELVFFTYPGIDRSGTDGQLLYATNFVDRSNGYNVQMTFKTSDPNAFQLFELVVFEPGQFNRRRVIYREQDTQWAFRSEDVDDALNIKVNLFEDLNDDNQRAADEPPWRDSQASVTLFRCGNQDGLVGTQRNTPDGTTTFISLEPGFYQLAVTLKTPLQFSTGRFDAHGNLLNVIKSSDPRPNEVIGYSACTDFTDGSSAFGQIGILLQR